MAEQARYDSYMSPEDRIDVEKRTAEQGRTFDEKFKDAYAKLEKKSRMESYGRGQDSKEEVLGNFKKGWYTLRGMRSRMYAFEMGGVNVLRDKVEKRQNKIDLIRKDKELYQEGLRQLSATTSRWRVDKRASLAIESAKRSVTAGISEMPHYLAIGALSMIKSADEWVAEVLKGDVSTQYNRAIHDLKSTREMEKIIGKYYSKALVHVPENGFSELFEDNDKNEQMQKIALMEGDDFIKSWEEFRSTLTNEELSKLDTFLTERLKGKDKKMVERLRKQINKIYDRPDVHDYQEIKYLEDVQKNMNNGKKLYDGMGLLKSSDIQSKRVLDGLTGASEQAMNILKRLRDDEQKPNIAYMLCDAVDFYIKGKKKLLGDALAELLVKSDGSENEEFLDKLRSIDQSSVNNMLKVNFHVRNEFNAKRKEVISNFRNESSADVVSVDVPQGLNVRADFVDVPVTGRPLYDLAYDVYNHKKIKSFDDPKRSRLALYISARLLQSRQEKFDPGQKLSATDFGTLRTKA